MKDDDETSVEDEFWLMKNMKMSCDTDERKRMSINNKQMTKAAMVVLRCQALLGYTKIHLVQPNSTELCYVPLNSTELFLAPPLSTELYQTSPDFSECRRAPPKSFWNPL